MSDEVIYRVEHGGLVVGGRVLFQDLSFTLAQHRTTVLLGPSGIGKSLILKQISGASNTVDVQRTGVWSLTSEAPSDQPLIVHQAPRDVESSADSRRKYETTLHNALHSNAGFLLLDEPSRGLSLDSEAALVEHLLSQRGRRTFAIVTHDLNFARQISDDLLLFVAGRLEVAGPTSEVYTNPPTELCRRFLAQGNCWPMPPPPPLPDHFCWIIPNKLAGMGQPGLLRETSEDLEAIAHAGVEVMYSLTHTPMPQAELRPFGIEGRHLPIEDMGIPEVGPLLRALSRIRKSIESGQGVVVHCHAGLGRTGTVLAAYLIFDGMSAEDAIAEVRRHNPKFIQSRAQLDFLRRLESETR